MSKIKRILTIGTRSPERRTVKTVNSEIISKRNLQVFQIGSQHFSQFSLKKHLAILFGTRVLIKIINTMPSDEAGTFWLPKTHTYWLGHLSILVNIILHILHIIIIHFLILAKHYFNSSSKYGNSFYYLDHITLDIYLFLHVPLISYDENWR